MVAYGATVRAQAEIPAVIVGQVQALEDQVEAHFVAHPDAEIYLCQPGLGKIPGARMPAESGDDGCVHGCGVRVPPVAGGDSSARSPPFRLRGVHLCGAARVERPPATPPAPLRF
ncbi:hypothetical protein Aros01_08512 [Streptosporangium roseum]